MKKTIGIAACAAAALLLASCAKEGQGLFKGNYTFKTSGSVSAELSIENTDGSSSSTLDLDLETEQGQMDILKTGSGDGGMIVTMNVLGGDVYTAQAKVQDEVLVLEPYTRYVRLEFPDFGHKNMPEYIERIVFCRQVIHLLLSSPVSWKRFSEK